MNVVVHITLFVWFYSAQEWTNRTLAIHERVDSRFLVLPGSESTITKITEYIYFSPLKPCNEFEYKCDWNTVIVDLMIEPILFLWNIIFTFYYTRVRPQCDYSILGRCPMNIFRKSIHVCINNHNLHPMSSYVSVLVFKHKSNNDTPNTYANINKDFNAQDISKRYHVP